jgi:hypothetical protein
MNRPQVVYFLSDRLVYFPSGVRMRWRHTGVVIDPTTLMVEGWRQKDYHEFWLRVIERHVRASSFWTVGTSRTPCVEDRVSAV